MGQRISEDKVNLIREKNDIVDVVSEYVQLKKQGRNYFGLCPFHGESTPSFSVAADKQIFHCFGCGAGGNVFTFLMDIEGISFVEAAKKLADKATIILEVDGFQPVNKQHSQEEKMVEAHDLLRKLYHHVLLNTDLGQEPLNYLLSRGFANDSIKKFQIGYAFNSWDYVKNFLDKRGFSPELMEQAGLLVKSESGFGDRFRHRIMFPIFDQQGRTIAFSGRALGDGNPKYLNSPETPIFNKSKILYNFHNARPIIRRQNTAILFEGFADVIAADEASVENSVATMGTSLTVEHLQILKRTSKKVIICYDTDNAGIQAASRTSDMLQQAGFQVLICVMPEGYDPDDYIKKFGAEKFQKEIVAAARSFISFKMFVHRRGKNFANEGEKMVYIESILEEIAKVQNIVEREFYLKLIADEFGLSLNTLLKQEEKIFSQNKKTDQHLQQNRIPDYFVKARKLKPAYQIAEENLISFMLKDKALTERIQQEGQLFNIEVHQQIANLLIRFFNEGHSNEVSLFINYLDDASLRTIVTEIEMKSLQTEPSEQEINDYIAQIKDIYQMNQLIKQKEFDLGEAERLQDLQMAAQIGLEIVRIKKSLGKSNRRE